MPGMVRILWVKVPVQEAIRRAREAQGRNREVGSEGSVNQNCEPMNKKRMRGGTVWTSVPQNTKSVSPRDSNVYSTVVQRRIRTLPWEICLAP